MKDVIFLDNSSGSDQKDSPDVSHVLLPDVNQYNDPKVMHEQYILNALRHIPLMLTHSSSCVPAG